MNELVTKSQILNNLLATVPGNALDAVQGKNLQDQITQLNGDWRAFHKTIALNDTYTTVPLDIDMGGVFEVFVNATYDGFYNFDAARLSNTSIRVRCFRSGIQQTSGNVQISILVIK